MKYGKLIILTSMLFLLIFSIGIATAHENTTDVICDDSDNYNAQIIAKSTSREYRQYMGNEIIFTLKDLDGNPIEDEKPQVTYDNKKIKTFWDDENHYGKGWGTYVLDVDPQVGNHKVKIELNTTKYLAKPVFINVNITKMDTKLTLKKYVTTTSEYAVLKAIVKDKKDGYMLTGKVKFKVNGKTYTVNVKNGVATKKIKLGKAKTYTYSTTFTAKNFKSKYASSKLYIKKTKKYYTLKIRNPKINKNFKGKLSYKQYVKILNAKNNGKYAECSVYTGQKRPESYGGGYYYIGLSTGNDYFTHYGYDLGDYIFLSGGGGYLDLKKVNLYTSNF